MAQLKDSIVSGSLRVTDTTYTNDLIIGNTTAPTIATNDYLILADASDNNKILKGPILNTSNTTKWLTQAGTWTAPTATDVGLGNVTNDTQVKAIGSTDNVAVRFDGANGQIQGSRLTITDEGYFLRTSSTRYPGDVQLKNSSNNAVAEYWYDTGNNTNVTSGQYHWRQYSPNSTANTSTTGKYEDYILPAVAAGLTENKTYSIITTKNLSSITSVGTISSGTWQGTKLGIAYGGTNATNATDAKANLGLGHIFYGTCDTTAATVDKVVTCAEFTKTAPDIGDVLFVKFTYTNSGARANLNLQIGDKANTKKPLRWLNNAGVAQIPGNGYIVANHTYEFYYDGTNWIIDLQYDSNSNDTATLIRDYGGNVAIVTTTTALYYCELLFSVVDTNNGWKAIPANTTKKGNSSTAKTNIFTSEFNPFGNIYYYVTDADVAANATIRADRVYRQYPVDIRYSFNCGSTLTASKDVYLVAYMTGSCKAKLRNPRALDSNAAATATGANAGPITQTLPTSADGYIYIKLGPAYSSYQFDLTLDHPIYYHDGVAIRLLAQTTSYGTTLPANGREGQTFFQVSDPWYELPPGGTSGQVLTKASNSDRDVSWASPSQAGVNEIANMIYPIGSIYMSVNSTDPSTLFGGTWERLKDRFLLSAGDSYSAGNTGGEANHKLTESELPGHTHTLSSHTHSLQSHTHSLQSHTHSGPSHTHTVTNGASNGFATFTTGSDTQGTGVGFQVSGTYRAGYSPKTSADGTGQTGGPSNNTSGGPSNNTSGGPSTNTSGSTGSNTAHNNMPPYLVVYMWKRTA